MWFASLFFVSLAGRLGWEYSSATSLWMRLFGVAEARGRLVLVMSKGLRRAHCELGVVKRVINGFELLCMLRMVTLSQKLV